MNSRFIYLLAFLLLPLSGLAQQQLHAHTTTIPAFSDGDSPASPEDTRPEHDLAANPTEKTSTPPDADAPEEDALANELAALDAMMDLPVASRLADEATDDDAQEEDQPDDPSEKDAP